jgi:hypothetical protein
MKRVFSRAAYCTPGFFRPGDPKKRELRPAQRPVMAQDSCGVRDIPVTTGTARLIAGAGLGIRPAPGAPGPSGAGALAEPSVSAPKKRRPGIRAMTMAAMIIPAATRAVHGKDRFRGAFRLRIRGSHGGSSGMFTGLPLVWLSGSPFRAVLRGDTHPVLSMASRTWRLVLADLAGGLLSGTAPGDPVLLRRVPHFLQNAASSTKISKPQPGQIFPFASVIGGGTTCTAGASGKPHRSQNRD